MIAQSSRTQENHCGTCGSGFGMTSTFSCETCSATDFQYSSENDNSPCADHVRCASGSGSNFDTLTNSQAVAASCQACLVGTHSDVNDYGPCDACGDSEYQTEVGQDQCNACTAFCTAGFTETTACTASTDRVCTQNVCTCDQGTAATGAACTADGDLICASCDDGYSQVTGSPFCTNTDDCTASTCLNGGFCFDDTSAIHATICNCAAGYTGDFCETDIDDCESAPCQNGGTCTDGFDSFACTCATGWSGETCEADINECAANQPELMFTDKHPDIETPTTMWYATNSGRTKTGVIRPFAGANDEQCKAICQEDPECNYVWVYKRNGGCHFKASYVHGTPTTCNRWSSYDTSLSMCMRNNHNSGGGHYFKISHATNSCHDNAACANTAGSHTCTCNAGFHGTGESCTACTSCGAGFTETTACTASTDTVCTQNICTCDQGTEATGTACTAVAGHICASCLHGYCLTRTACAAPIEKKGHCPVANQVGSKADCFGAAATDAGLSDFTTHTGSWSYMPKGCSYRKSDNKLMWNTWNTLCTGGNNGEYQPLCIVPNNPRDNYQFVGAFGPYFSTSLKVTASVGFPFILEVNVDIQIDFFKLQAVTTLTASKGENMATDVPALISAADFYVHLLAGSVSVSITFLPNILDSSAKERNDYLETLRSVSQKNRKNPFNYFWLSAGDQLDLERNLGLGFGFPAVVLVQPKKKQFGIMRSS